MKKLSLLALFICATYACKEDDSRSCINCSSAQTPTFELCRESNGNASVNGEDTGTVYEVYLDGLIDAGTSCGG